MMRLKKVIESGAAGRILHAAVNSYWWRGTWEKESGGCTLNHAVHHADLLLWMMGKPERAQAFFTNLNHHNSETEDFSTTVLIYPDGAAAQLTASLVHHGEDQEMIFQGENARISFPWDVYASSSLENGFPERDHEKEKRIRELYESLPALEHEGHKAQIENLLDSIESGAALLVDGESGRRTLELIFGIYKSAITGTSVSFPLSPKDPFYRRDTMLPLVPRFHQKTKNLENYETSSITLGRTE